MIPRRLVLLGGTLALVPALARAQASSWPTHPVALIIPFPAGGAMDLLGRGVAQGPHRQARASPSWSTTGRRRRQYRRMAAARRRPTATPS